MQNAVVSPTVRAHVGDPKHFGDAGPWPPWDAGVAIPLKTRSDPTCVTIPNFVVRGSNRVRVITEICQKFLTPRAPPFKVI